MPARKGDCTSVRKRVSTSGSSAVRGGAAATARRALKVRSSILVFTLSAAGFGSDRGARGRSLGPIVGALVGFDQLFHPDGVPLRMPVAPDRPRAAARLNQHVGEQRPRVDLHPRTTRNRDPML